MLRQLGASVLTAEDGLSALATLMLERVDLVFCDLHMPRMDGFGFLADLQRLQGPDHPPVIAVSALADSTDHVHTGAAGFDGHLDKPFDTEGLLAIAGAVLARRTHRPFPSESSSA
jgi:CheY-like chemotaxis protein